MPVARRWKAEINENAKLPAFFSELPEANHNELCGWGVPDSRLAAVLPLEPGSARMENTAQVGPEREQVVVDRREESVVVHTAIEALAREVPVARVFHDRAEGDIAECLSLEVQPGDEPVEGRRHQVQVGTPSIDRVRA